MKIASNKVSAIVRFFRDELEGLYDSTELETIIRYCFEEFLDVPYYDLEKHKNDTVSESELLKFNFAVKDLKAEKPLQYIFGRADFFGLKLHVNEHVLIPRPETEELVDLIISDMSNIGGTPRLLDIGTGSGCIAIALKKNLPQATLHAMDISEPALDVARENALINGVDISFIADDILKPRSAFEADTFDVIVSNPPYIRLSEKENMSRNVLAYEPHLALFVDDTHPLLFYSRIADFALKTLARDGALYFEINGQMGAETAQLMKEKGFKNVALFKDMSNKNRILRVQY